MSSGTISAITTNVALASFGNPIYFKIHGLIFEQRIIDNTCIVKAAQRVLNGFRLQRHYIGNVTNFAQDHLFAIGEAWQ